MSYSKVINYRVLPHESFKVIANCSGCGTKSLFQNTNCFRVNANGNKIDVWLIYQCSKCKHTKNLTVHERCKPESIDPEIYRGYQNNSSTLATKLGTDSHFFSVNRAEIDWANLSYRIEPSVEASRLLNQGDLLIITNPYALKIRPDKLVAEILDCSRAEVKKRQKVKVITITENKKDHQIRIKINESIES